MNRIVRMTLVVSIAAATGACSSSRREARTSTPVPPLYVPTTAIVQAPGPATNAVAMNAYQILPAGDADQFFVGRPEKFVYGQTVFAESTEFSIFTYDQQLISTLWGPSYRYRYIIQNGFTSP